MLAAYAVLLQAVPMWQSLSGPHQGLGTSLASLGTAPGMSIPLWRGVFSAPLPVDPGMPLHPLIVLLGALLVALLGAFWNEILRDLKDLDIDSWLPGMAFVWFASILGAGFDPATFGCALLLIAFARSLNAYGLLNADQHLLQAGVAVGAASLLGWPYAVFLVFAILANARLRPLTGREAGVLVAGFAAVYVLAWSWAYCFGHPTAWAAAQFRWVGLGDGRWLGRLGWLGSGETGAALVDQPGRLSGLLVLRYGLPLLLLGAAFVYAQSRLLRTLVLIRKATGLAGWFSLFAAIAWVGGVSPACGVAAGASYFVAFFAKRSAWPKTWELIHALILAGWFAFGLMHTR
jgi:hypothetical protein